MRIWILIKKSIETNPGLIQIIKLVIVVVKNSNTNDDNKLYLSVKHVSAFG